MHSQTVFNFILQQECITVGCVSPASVAISGGGGCLPRRGVCLGGVCPEGVCLGVSA